MNDFQIKIKKNSQSSLHKNEKQNIKKKNLPPTLKNIILINNLKSLEVSSQYRNYKNFKSSKFDRHFMHKYTTYNNSYNKSLSPINKTPNNKNINLMNKDILLNKKISKNHFERKFGKFNLKKDESQNNYNSKENKNYNVTNINYIHNINIINTKKSQIKINILQKKSNIKLSYLKENNISSNPNKYILKSLSISKSKSKSKNKNKSKKEKKGYNNRVNDNINKAILAKYLKSYRIGRKNKNNRNKLNFLYKEYSNFSTNKYSKENSQNTLQNVVNNQKLKGFKKKYKSSNLLIRNFHKTKSKVSNSKINIMIYKDEKSSNNKVNDKDKNNKINKSKNNKKYLEKENIIYLINQNKNKKKSKKNKNNQISLKDNKNNKNKITKIIITKINNTNSDKSINNHFYDNKNKRENIIGDYSNKNVRFRKIQNIKEVDDNNLVSKKNMKIDNQYENYENIYKILNERLKTDLNDNSLYAIDKIYENEKNEGINHKSKSLSKRDSLRFLYPEIYMKDDENYLEIDNDNNSFNKSEKELDEIESSFNNKMDTDKTIIEDSGILSFDQVEDIVCYYDMKNGVKQNDFLFQKNERQIYNINCKNKYLKFFIKNSAN